MSIVGIESVTYGVEDLEICTRFYEDFGLVVTRRDEQSVEFVIDEGSRIVLRKQSDPSLPPAWFDGPGIREAVFGVDSDASLDALSNDLSRDREVTQDRDGTVHFQTDDGIPLGLRVFERKRVTYSPDPVNAPGRVERLNTHRKWKARARPKTINHVVFKVNDPDAGLAFFRDRLGFRLSDISRGLGVFMRASGANEHHNLFLQQTLPMPGYEAGPDHVCFGVEDVDEIMVGANHMKRKGWNSALGLGRHRIASALFYYVDSPCGGRAEYGADTDYLDDTWVPRVWEPTFGFVSWSSTIPPFIQSEPAWDVTFVGEYVPNGSRVR